MRYDCDLTNLQVEYANEVRSNMDLLFIQQLRLCLPNTIYFRKEYFVFKNKGLCTSETELSSHFKVEVCI